LTIYHCLVKVESCVHSVIFWSDKNKTDTEARRTPDTAPASGPSQADTSSLETPKVEIDATETEEKAEVHPLEASTFDNPALVHLLTNAGLLERLIKAWSNPSVPPTVAYMGHVTRISNDLVTACGTGTPISTAGTPLPSCHSRTLLLQLVAKLPEETQETWNSIVSGKLAETNKMNEIKPATDEKRIMSSDDEDSDFRDIQFPQDSVLEKVMINGVYLIS